MPRFKICLFVGGMLLLTGCTNMPHFGRKAEGHTTEETALYRNDGKDKDEDSESDSFSKHKKSSKPGTGDEENPFAEARKGSSRLKESDGLTKVLDSFSDPRKAEIYRDLGID